MAPRKKRPAFEIAGHKIEPGEHKSLTLALPGQSRYVPLAMPVKVIHGSQPGPVGFISAAIHGDEINGVEIVRQVSRHKSLNRLKGTLICVPVVNVYGFFNHSRYTPDRRDLNRSFPGSSQGSLAGRIAEVFRREIIDRSDFGVDLHTGSNHRTNYPHIRADLSDAATKEMALCFDTPVVIDSTLRDGSLRGYALSKKIPTLLYEAGEALRYDPLSISAGVRGCLNVLAHMGMVRRRQRRRHTPTEATGSHWIRAPRSGMLRATVQLGRFISEGDPIAVVADLLGEDETVISAPEDGVLIGQNLMPRVNQGDAIFHVAEFSTHAARFEQAVEHFESSLEGLSDFDYSTEQASEE